MHILTPVLLCGSAFGSYAGRVRFESGSPTENSALLIPSTKVSDEGRYICRISAFPNGNFERHVTLTVWSKRDFLSSLRATTVVSWQIVSFWQ